jgi:hypothetical protein
MGFLSASSLLSLRLCSRTLAVCIPVDQRFFLSSLLKGDIPCLWDVDKAKCLEADQRIPERLAADSEFEERWNWKAVVDLLKDAEAIILSRGEDISGAIQRSDQNKEESSESTPREEAEGPESSLTRYLSLGLWNRVRIWRIVEDALAVYSMRPKMPIGAFSQPR